MSELNSNLGNMIFGSQEKELLFLTVHVINIKDVKEYLYTNIMVNRDL